MAFLVAAAAAAAALSLLLFAWSRRCRRLRQLRLRRINSLDSLVHAHSIVTHTISVEFPFLYHAALDFALFRTFAIPSISALLRRSGHFSSASAALKRYDNTDLLVMEMLLHHSDSHRGSTALRRLNFIHSKFPTITNDEYLYVLCLFMIWPPRFCKSYGHRQWSSTEELAYFTVWRDIGAKMGIRDIPASLPMAVELAERYEAAHMAYAGCNRAVADPMVAIILGEFPAILRPLARRVAFALLDDPVMAAIGYPLQPRWLRKCVGGALKLCTGGLVGWLMPPRPLEKAAIRIGQLGGGASPPESAAVDDASGKIRVQFRRFPSQRGEYEETGYRIEELGMAQPGRLAPPPTAVAQLPFPSSLWPTSILGDYGPEEKDEKNKRDKICLASPQAETSTLIHQNSAHLT